MGYDNSSFRGDLLCLEYDEANNPVNPPSPFGFFLYNVIGGVFDSLDEMVNQFFMDTDILSCDEQFINMYGRYWGLPNPSVNGRLLTPKEYRVYLYLKNCQLITVEDLSICFNKCLGLEGYDVRISKQDLSLVSVVDHVHYVGGDDYSVSNIQPNPQDLEDDKITSHGEDMDYNKLRGRTGHQYNMQVVVEIPYQEWSQDFLDLLMSFISVKGNVLVKEYKL